ncbi:MAG: DciA family protein [Desulfurivibrionaceae bacterium]
MKKPEPISSLLAGIIGRKKWSHKLDLHRVFTFWPEIVGDDVACWARPHLIRGNVLWISVVDSMWMQQLYMQKVLFLEKINERLTGPGFSDLRFQVNSNMICFEGSPEAPEKSEKSKVPAKEELEEFKKRLDSIPDPQVRKALFNYWYRVKNIRK